MQVENGSSACVKAMGSRAGSGRVSAGHRVDRKRVDLEAGQARSALPLRGASARASAAKARVKNG